MTSTTSVGSFESKMLAAKQKNRQAEMDRQLLMNRIALLKKEEERAWQKIKKTRARSEEIVQLRTEHRKSTVSRSEAQQRELERQKREVEAHIQMEEEARQKRMKNLEALRLAKREDVSRVREEAAAAREEVRARRLEEVVQKQQKRAGIRKREEELKEKRGADRQRLVEANRKHYEQRVAKQLEETQHKERDVMRMERKEMKLIQKLKKTQIMQQLAYEDLEHALNGDLAQVADPHTFQAAAKK